MSGPSDHSGKRSLRSLLSVRSIAGQVLLLQVGLLVLLIITAVVALVLQAQRSAERAADRLSLGMAEAFAYSPGMVRALGSRDPTAVLQPLAEQVRKASGVDYVVVGNTEGIRYTHPDPRLIGKHVIGPYKEALGGKAFTQTFAASRGPAVNSVVPVTRPDGSVAGLVWVGITVQQVQTSVGRQLPVVLGSAAMALTLATGSSALVGRRLRRQTRGLGPIEMTRMYEHQDAVLHSVREGVLILDKERRLLLANDEARRLLGLPPDAEGRPFCELGLKPRTAELLGSGRVASDEVVEAGDRLLAVNVRIASVQGRPASTVATLRDTTELQALMGEQAALRRVATLVARGVGPDRVFTAVADEVATLIGADDTAVVRFEPDGEATVMGGHAFLHSESGSRGKLDPRLAMASVQATGRAARRDVDALVDDLEWASPPATTPPGPPGSTVASPIVVEGRVWGAIGVGSRRERLPHDTEQRLADFTELVATAIANAASRDELTMSRARIVAAADQTRQRIERDLHDGAQQRLVTLALQLRAAQAKVPPELNALAAELDELVGEAIGALDELHVIAHGIHPAILARKGLGTALRTLARRSPIPVDLDVRTKGRLPQDIEVSAYYLVAEALTNAAKHARASAVTITVEADTTDAILRVAVHDDGVGGADFARGTGLTGLKDRVEALGGRIHLDSPRGEGTSLRAELPLTATNSDVTPEDK